MPIKLRITLTIIIDSSASIIGIAKSSAWCFGLAPEVNTQRAKWPTSVPMVIVAGNKMVACAALIMPSA